MDEAGIEELTARLKAEFHRLNAKRFSGELDDYAPRLSRSSVRVHGSVNFRRKQIRISLPMYEQNGWGAVVNTLLHEMTHALLHKTGHPGRHTKLFWEEFKRRGGVRDRIDVQPQSCYIYACRTCGREIRRMRKLKRPWMYSCRRCDKRYNPRHRLYLKKDKNPASILKSP